MSENPWNDAAGRKTLSRAAIMELLTKNFERLPDTDQKLFVFGPLIMGVNAGIAGLVANSLYRRVFNVRQAVFTSALPMFALPLLCTFTTFNSMVCRPLFRGDLHCPSCVLMRGGLVGMVAGGLYPIFLALPINIALASRYNTAPMPEKGNHLRHWVDISKPIVKKMRVAVLIQVIFGSCLGSGLFESYVKLVDISTNPETEELRD